MSDKRIKMPMQESSESGTQGSDGTKTGYNRDVPSDVGAKKKEESNEQGT